MSSFKSIHKFVDIEGTIFYVEAWGRWIEDSAPDEIIIFVPGNPGIISFYTEYLENLHKITNIPVWTISHVGHEEPSIGLSKTRLSDFSELKNTYDLIPQVLHKRNFILKYTKSETKIHIIGHSIGAWMVLEMLKQADVRERIKSSILIFPTIQNMSESPNGKWLNGPVRKHYNHIQIIVKLFYCMPLFIRTIVTASFLLFQSIPLSFLNSALSIGTPTVVEKILFLAFDEMDKVKELDINTLYLIKDKVHIIYNDNDGWAPKEYFENLKNCIDGISLQCVPFSHSFSLKSSKELAFITAGYI